MSIRRILSVLFFISISLISYSQKEQDTTSQRTDSTLFIYTLPTHTVYYIPTPENERERRKLRRLIRNVKMVYPYAKLAGIKLKEYNDILEKEPDNRKRRKIMKRAEKEIEEEFGTELRNLTFSQGKVLIKLIDRETGDDSYHLVQELRGKFRAFFYQAIARLFGYNLKKRYDPEGEDKQIETIVRMIEKGQL